MTNEKFDPFTRRIGQCIHGNSLATCYECHHGPLDTKSVIKEFVKLLQETKEAKMKGKLEMSTEFQRVAKEIGDLVTEKNKAYGDSFAKTGEFLQLLYPDGIKPEQYGDALSLVRIFDKMMRIATDRDAFGESPYRDIAGYSLLGIVKNIARKDPAEISETEFVKKISRSERLGDKKELLIENKFYDRSRKAGSPAGVCPSCLSGALYRTEDNKIRCTECRYEDADILAIP